MATFNTPAARQAAAAGAVQAAYENTVAALAQLREAEEHAPDAWAIREIRRVASRLDEFIYPTPVDAPLGLGALNGLLNGDKTDWPVGPVEWDPNQKD